jgi:hypothetical protein
VAPLRNWRSGWRREEPQQRRQQDEAAFGRYRTKDEVLALLPLLAPAAPPI